METKSREKGKSKEQFDLILFKWGMTDVYHSGIYISLGTFSKKESGALFFN